VTDREALAAALQEPGRGNDNTETSSTRVRERLAQLPEKCGSCGGDGEVGDVPPDMDQLNIALGHFDVITCPTCHGRGTVYPPALVERVIRAIADRAPFDARYNIAVAVLDALNGETE
jgi:hypothetical protein